MPDQALAPMPLDRVSLLPSECARRADLNQRYLLSLRTENLLQNHYLEAGLWAPREIPPDTHLGWETPTCQLRGHFLGHWLSAAARRSANTGDHELRGKADQIVAELARCQAENGDGWAGSIPRHYLDWVARHKPVWAPHYTLHKTLMGLLDMARYAGSAQALEVAARWADWFHRWTEPFSREQLDDILDVETGGMLEAWADLYALTGEKQHLDLIRRYDRPRLFDRLLAGEDALTNWHANTTIPEAQGAARAWEVTGEERWRAIVEAYWDFAVTRRGAYATGGQTCGEIWSPPHQQAARLGDKNQEHCTVYNLMRLAEYLWRWTGDPRYADYWERNLINGVWAQQHPDTGMIAYFLPLEPGAQKAWGSATHDFWCCHGSLVQAHTLYPDAIYYSGPSEDGRPGFTVAQYIPSVLRWEQDGTPLEVTLRLDPQTGRVTRPDALVVDLTLKAPAPVDLDLRLRVPWWLAGKGGTLAINGAEFPLETGPSEAIAIEGRWHDDHVRLTLPMALTTQPLPDDPGRVAFMYGPTVLAGLSEGDEALVGDPAGPEALLAPDNEREWAFWRPGWRTVGQRQSTRFLPLHAITDQRYTVYWPVRS
ncbi:MAG: beta-L-arabinofuranosidase domain-containing protein [Anaerolineae bacterium]|jgi:DUF1680 family protein|nr:hypothetical protein [Chloroflexota bacterium]